MELKTFEDWIVEPQYRAVPGVADDQASAAATMQYQVLLDPAKLAARRALGAAGGKRAGGQQRQRRRRLLFAGRAVLLRPRRRAGSSTLEDIGNVVLAVHNGMPVLVKDVGRVVIGIAPRLGEFGFENQDDAVEGVILMRKGEKTQDVLKQVEAKTKELNQHVLPKDVKVVPFYDRSDLIAFTTRSSSSNLLRGMMLVVVVLMFFLYDFRAGLIVAVTIPLALLFAFICLHIQRRVGQSAVHRRGGLRHPGRWRDLHGREHLPPDRRCAKARPRRSTRSSGRGGGGGPAAVLRGRRDRRRLPADLRADRAVGRAVPADGGHHDLRA